MKIGISPYIIPLKEPFRYYLDTLYSLPYAKIVLTDQDGYVGEGEIPCALDITGETFKAAQHLEPFLAHLLRSVSIDTEQDITNAMEYLDFHIVHNTATKCGIEQAMYNILAKKTHNTLANIFGKKHDSVSIQRTIACLDSAEKYKEVFDDIISRMPYSVKFKIGHNIKEEVQAIRTLRMLMPDLKINIDANQSFSTVDKAIEFIGQIEHVGLSWIEQPFPRGTGPEWAQLKRKTTVPLMADESVHNEHEAHLFLREGWADMINVKLAKTGGIRGARVILNMTKKYGAPSMLGSMLHGKLGIHYNLAFALSADFVTHDFFSYFSIVTQTHSPYIDRDTFFTTPAVLA